MPSALEQLQIMHGPQWPSVVSLERDDTTAELTLAMDPTMIWFDGHYPGMPIFPGVAQVHLAICYGTRLFQIEQAFLGMDAVKFSQVVKPSDQVTLKLEFNAERGRLAFTFRNRSAHNRSSNGNALPDSITPHKAETVSSGRILFGARV